MILLQVYEKGRLIIPVLFMFPYVQDSPYLIYTYTMSRDWLCSHLRVIQCHYTNTFYHVGFEALTAVAKKSSVFWNITSCPLHTSFLLDLPFDPEDGDDVLPNRRLTFTGLHVVISQKIEFRVVTFYFTIGDEYWDGTRDILNTRTVN
jgi:hypothetical protein